MGAPAIKPRRMTRGALAALPALLALLTAAGPCRAQSAPAVPPAAAAQAAAPAEPQGGLSVAQELGQQVWQVTWDALQGQSVIIGGGYTQGTLKFRKFRGDPAAQVQITDNGRLTLLLQYETSESYLLEVPLQAGRVAIGYNIAASYGGLEVDRHLSGNAFQGEALGSSVRGDYLVAAPLLFVRMGPLYPDRAVFWKFGVGVGGGLVRLQGQVLPYGGTRGEALEPVDSKGAVATLFTTATWELEIERWLIAFKALNLAGKAGEDPFTYEVYSLSLGYKVRF
jgi:hypothetical protein